MYEDYRKLQIKFWIVCLLFLLLQTIKFSTGIYDISEIEAIIVVGLIIYYTVGLESTIIDYESKVKNLEKYNTGGMTE